MDPRELSEEPAPEPTHTERAVPEGNDVKTEDGDAATPLPDSANSASTDGSKRLPGTPGNGQKVVSRAMSMRSQEARMVYFNPADVLPQQGKPVGEFPLQSNDCQNISRQDLM